MIEFHDVSKTFAGRPAVSHLNLHFEEGAFTVLIGTSGSGKSTTLKMINRLVEHDSGLIRFAGEEIRSLPVLELRRRMGYAIQSIGLFPHWTVAQNIATVPQLEKWSRQKINARVDELMALLGLEPALRERYPHQLSGGQRQRVAIARALILEPQVLLLDEPTSALDVSVQAEILNLLAELQRESNLTYLMVTHDLGVIAHLCQKVAVMQYGKILESLTVDALVAGQAKTDYTRMLVNASQQYSREMAREVAVY